MSTNRDQRNQTKVSFAYVFRSPRTTCVKAVEDEAYENAKKNIDPANSKTDALGRVKMSVLKDDTQLFKQFNDNEDIHHWRPDAVFRTTYGEPA